MPLGAHVAIGGRTLIEAAVETSVDGPVLPIRVVRWFPHLADRLPAVNRVVARDAGDERSMTQDEPADGMFCPRPPLRVLQYGQ